MAPVGMASRKRARVGERADAPTISAREIESSNATLHSFLNPTAKSWMTQAAGRQAVTKQPTPSKRVNPPRSDKSERVGSSAGLDGTFSSCTQKRTQPVRSQTDLRLSLGSSSSSNLAIPMSPSTIHPLATETHHANDPTFRNLSASAIISPRINSDSTNSQISANRVSLVVNPVTPLARSVPDFTEHVLPSPSPSEDRHRSPATNDQDNHVISSKETSVVSSEAVQSTETIQQDSARLLELAARYGGIEALEKQLELLQASTTQSSVTGLLRTALQSTALIPDTETQSHASAAIPDSIPQQEPQLASRPGQAMSSRLLMPAIPPVPETLRRTPLTTPFTDYFDDTRFAHYIQLLDQRLHSVQRDPEIQQQRRHVEIGRLTLLKDACVSRDITYLALHQLYCLADRVAAIHPYVERVAATTSGLRMLRSLIVTNNNLPPESLHWYTTFPLNFHFLVDHPRYRACCEQICRFLGLAGASWQQYSVECMRTRTPPSVTALAVQLGVSSPILQNVMFKSICRSFWTGISDGCFEKLEERFRGLQQAHVVWTRQPQTPNRLTWTEFEKYQDGLVKEYKRVARIHQQHTHSHTVNPTGLVAQASTNSMRLGINLNQPHNARVTGNGIRMPSANSQIAQQSNTPRIFSSSSAQNNTWMGNPHQTQDVQPTSHSSIVAQAVPGQQMNPVSGIYTQTQPQYSSTVSSGPAAIPVPDLLSQQQQPTIDHTQTTRPAVQLAGTARQRSVQNIPYVRRSFIPISPGQVLLTRVEQSQAQYQSGNLPTPSPLLFPPTRGQSYHYSDTLLQAHLRSPRNMLCDMSGTPLSEINFLSCLSSFAVGPYIIKPSDSNISNGFQISKEEFKRLPTIEQDYYGAPSRRSLKLGSLLFQLRCIKPMKESIQEHEWSVADTSWPPSIVISLNDEVVEIRRKVLHGKDLPADVTSLVREGANSVRVAILRGKDQQELKQSYCFAIEVSTIIDAKEVGANISQLSEAHTESRIKSHLSASDSEIEVLSSDLVIKVIDPFSAQLIQTPVRGKHCLHYECFDLEIFLGTRQKKAGFEKFRCPICNSDARPQSLQLDKWFLNVLQSLRCSNLLETRAIVVNKDGTWQVKEEELEGESGEGTGKRKRETETPPSTSLQRIPVAEHIVIELD